MEAVSVTIVCGAGDDPAKEMKPSSSNVERGD
jgi:hypothetical protein